MDWRAKKLRLSLNKRLLNKNELDDVQAFVEGWENADCTIDELADWVHHGFAYAPELRGNRKSENFTASDVLSADLDDIADLGEVQNNPLVNDHATLIYTTNSHTKEQPKLRIVFALERTITDAAEMRAATRSLALRLSGDGSVVDPSRIFYGSRDCKVLLSDKGISAQFLDELIEQGRNVQKPASSTNNDRPGTGRSRLAFSADVQVKTGNDELVAIKDLPSSTSICCPFHNDQSPSAFITENRSGGKGIHCSTCGTTFWEKDASEEIDFLAFDEAAKQVQEHVKVSDDIDTLFFQAQTQSYLEQSNIIFFDRLFVEHVDIKDGANFIKSPKASGKTEFLKNIVEGSGGTFLLIGHRRSLIKQMCNRLGLHCYLDETDKTSPTRENPYRRYGVCLDSIAKVPSDMKYDHIFIDECEQVIAHLLSETMERKRSHVFMKLRHLISTCKRVVALDADLGEVSFNHISKWSRIHDQSRKSHLWINTHQQKKGQLFVFDNKNQLIGDLHRSIDDGKRCYVTSNSKGLVHDLEVSIKDKHKSLNVIAITSDTVSEEGPVFDFLNNPSEQALMYDVILTSPSVSTGVDITFPENAALIDAVYAIFEPQVLTHFECDQQLLRVRNPKATKVHVASRTYNFETNFDVVLEDTLSLQLMDHLVENFDFDGKPQYNREDELLQIASSILSVQRASKNRLKKNFLDYKTFQGWEVVTVGADEKMRNEGSIVALQGKNLRKAEAIDALLNAEKVDRDQFDKLQEKKDAGVSLPTYENASYVRGLLEIFYRREISRELIEQDNGGRFRTAVRRFEELCDPEFLAVRASINKTRKETANDASFLFASEPMIVELIVDCLSAAGLYQDGEFAVEKEITKEDLHEFVAFLQNNKKRYELVLDQAFPKDLQTKPPSTLGQILKLVGLSLRRLRTKSVKGKKQYIYGIDKAKFAEISEIRALRKKKIG